jgi:anti-anti-sigma factor
MKMIVVSREGDKAVLHPSGADIVSSLVPELRAQMRGIVEEGVRDLVVDLANVQMVDSSGIGLLIAAHNSLHKLGGRLAVVHASKDILDLFHTMRIHQHFSVTGDGEK